MDNLLLNVFIILLSVFGLFALSHIFKGKYHRWLLVLLPSIAVLLCMTFPFTLFPGQIYDLRLAIILLGILYGGYGPGIAVTVTSFLYRYIIGGTGFVQMALTFSPFIACAFYITPRFSQYSKLQKIFVSAILTAVPVILNILVVEMRYPVKQRHLQFLAEWGMIELATTVLTVFLIETVRDNVEMTHHLQELEKSQLVNSLTASIAHEIRNPLTVCRGFLQLLKEENAEQVQTDYLDIVLDELDRAASVIDDYLSLSKPQVSKVESIKVSELIQQALASIASYATLHDVKVIQNFQNAVYSNVDVEKFTQSVFNIMKNGVEAMPEGGTLSVRVHRRRRAALITISDTGIGMNPEQIKQLGSPFYSTKQKGTGLSLMLSYQFIRLMEGHIQVTSKMNEGTTFSISLPLSDKRQSVLQTRPEIAGESSS